MKKLLFVVFALVTVSLLTPGTGLAQFGLSNQVGLNLNAEGTGATRTLTVGAPVNVFLVLTKPTDVENGEAPYTFVNYFECMLNFDPAGGLYKLEETLPPTGHNTGDSAQLVDGYLEYIVGIGIDWPVTDESVCLVTIQFMALVTTPIYITLGPATVQSIPGEMSFMSIAGDHRVMHPISGGTDVPVFTFNPHGLPVENESFGSVKALYR
jgi:hypothetical protein